MDSIIYCLILCKREQYEYDVYDEVVYASYSKDILKAKANEMYSYGFTWELNRTMENIKVEEEDGWSYVHFRIEELDVI